MSELEKDAFAEMIEGKISLGNMTRLALRSLFDPIKLLIMYMPGPTGYKIRQVYYGRTLRHLGKNSLIDVGVIMVGNENISIGSYTWIDSYVKIQTPFGSIKIGKGVHIAPGSVLLGHGGITLCDYVGIGSGSKIISGSDTPGKGKRTSPMIPMRLRNLITKPVVVGKDAFVGVNSTVLPGVTIGEGAIIGANSLVDKDIPPYSIAVGSPIRILEKKREKVTVEELY